MKKYLNLLSIILVMTLIFVGCQSTTPPKNNGGNGGNGGVKEEVLTIKDYYPFKENTMMEYEGIGNEYAEQQTFFEFIDGNRAQIKVANPGTTFTKVLEYKDGSLTEIFAEGEFYHIENMLNTTNENNNIILKEPLEVGNNWTGSDGRKKEITSLNAEIETPYGKYKALEVTTEFEEGRVQREYYAKDIGLVASIYKDGEMEVKTLLEDIKNQPLEIEMKSYYPMFNDIKTAYVEQNIEFNTNDSIERILETIMKNPPSDKLVPVISKNTKINKLLLDRGPWILKVDFSKELLSEMNAGSSMEAEILKSIVNTLGKLYDTDKVYISVDDVPYSSGHYSIREGEYFTVDESNVEEFK
ncbi:GerMN domain-containing protein [Tissierella sp. MSJ-40]|uniref:GerMN domain-containing protein n=1 Tax=Tissierella simiarum TaxID=2841534 RepID=A0ABS6E4N5_9FIRM|nr:GerMN domain-containing protein [Tissierella simiarum]MBU5437786.1 GerMN domain-containing protein [Tissierella simiarum]